MPAPTTAATDRFEWLVVAGALVAALAAVPPYAAEWAHGSLSWLGAIWFDQHFGRENLDAVFAVAFALLLVLPHPVRAGLTLPTVRSAKWRTLAVVASSVAVVAVFGRRLNAPPLRGSGTGYAAWLFGPVAEDVLFAGLLFGRFAVLWPGPVARWLPIDRAAVLAAVYFGLWQARLLRTFDPPTVLPLMAWAAAGGLAMGLVRQWTGSVLFVAVTHVTAGWLLWHDVGV